MMSTVIYYILQPTNLTIYPVVFELALASQPIEVRPTLQCSTVPRTPDIVLFFGKLKLQFFIFIFW